MQSKGGDMAPFWSLKSIYPLGWVFGAMKQSPHRLFQGIPHQVKIRFADKELELRHPPKNGGDILFAQPFRLACGVAA